MFPPKLALLSTVQSSSETKLKPCSSLSMDINRVVTSRAAWHSGLTDPTTRSQALTPQLATRRSTGCLPRNELLEDTLYATRCTVMMSNLSLSYMACISRRRGSAMTIRIRKQCRVGGGRRQLIRLLCLRQ